MTGTRIQVFLGKGGVGKNTCSAATALAPEARYDLRISRLVVNNVVQAADSKFLELKRSQQQSRPEHLRQRHGGVPMVEIPLFSQEVRGVERPRAVGRLLAGR